MTALTVNGSAKASTVTGLTGAGQMFAAQGGTTSTAATKVAKSTTFVQIFAIGTTTTQVGVGAIPTISDTNFKGWIWQANTLDLQRIAAGTWTPTFHMLASSAGTITPTVQWYKRSSTGVYTSIGSIAGSSIALTTTAQALTFTAPSLGAEGLCCW